MRVCKQAQYLVNQKVFGTHTHGAHSVTANKDMNHRPQTNISTHMELMLSSLLYLYDWCILLVI